MTVARVGLAFSLLLRFALAIRWVPLDTQLASQASSSARTMALYPLPAVYLPGSKCFVRNIEPRNIAMCRERTEFVAAFVDANRSRCAAVGAILRIDSVQPAAADAGQAFGPEGRSERSVPLWQRQEVQALPRETKKRLHRSVSVDE